MSRTDAGGADLSTKPHEEGAAPAHLRVARYLLVKSAAELLFVAALAAAFYLTTLRADLSGSIDAADARAVSGRVRHNSDPHTRPELQLFIDGRHAATLPPETTGAGSGGGREGHPFSFPLPALPSGAHEASVYAAGGEGPRRTLRLVAGPRRFVLE